MAEFAFSQDLLQQQPPKLTPNTLALLKQYGILSSLTFQQYTFATKFEPQNCLQFLSDLFSCQDFQQNFLLSDITGKHNKAISNKQTVVAVDQFVTIKHTKDFMPAISERYVGIDTWKGMQPQKLEYLDMDISFLIDSAFFDNTCQDYKSFPQSWRDELACGLLMLLRSGGNLNQQSDKVDDYIEPVLDMYTQMVKPVRLEAEEKLTLKHIFAYKVNALSNFELFPKNVDYENHPSNKCWVIIDTLRRFVTILHNAAWV